MIRRFEASAFRTRALFVHGRSPRTFSLQTSCPLLASTSAEGGFFKESRSFLHNRQQDQGGFAAPEMNSTRSKEKTAADKPARTDFSPGSPSV